jgi:hypothetical protein
VPSRCLLRLGVDLVKQIDLEVLAGMNAEWVGEWPRGKAVTVVGRWRMWGMRSDEDEDDCQLHENDRHGKIPPESKVHCLELNAVSRGSRTPITTPPFASIRCSMVELDALEFIRKRQ